MDEAVLVALPGDKLALLRDAVHGAGAALPDLHMVDITEVARNPSRLMAMEGSFAAEHSDRRVRVVSQLAWPGRTEDELVACSEHEALFNAALEGQQATVLCLYDASRLDDDVLADARATHPMLWKCGAPHRSAEYAPDDVLARCNRPLPGHPGAVTYMVRTSSDLRPARSFAVSYAGWIGLSQDGADDLQLIATELATNSLMYTDGACRLAFWRNDEHLVCEARDTGRLDDPLVGRLEPGPSGPASRGFFWSTPCRTWCARTRHRPARRSGLIFGLVRRPGRTGEACRGVVTRTARRYLLLKTAPPPLGPARRILLLAFAFIGRAFHVLVHTRAFWAGRLVVIDQLPGCGATTAWAESGAGWAPGVTGTGPDELVVAHPVGNSVASTATTIAPLRIRLPVFFASMIAPLVC